MAKAMAAHFHQQTVFWTTNKHLSRLENLAAKFGPYLRNIHIVPCHFTLQGLMQAGKRYRLRRSIAVSGWRTIGARRDSNHGQKELISVTQSMYLGWWATGRNWQLLHDDVRSLKFFLGFVGNVLSQAFMKSNKLTQRLARSLNLCPNSDMSVLKMSFDSEELGVNRANFGRGAPEWAFEVSVFCDGGIILYDGVYERKVQESVALATAGVHNTLRMLPIH